jgi:hypothetical protein
MNRSNKNIGHQYIIAAMIPILLSLSACAGREEVETVHDPVPVVVTAPCIAAQGLPAKVTPLRDQISAADWDKRPPGAKAKTVEAQAGARLNYEDALAAATSGCK